jgi:5-methylcytosine-specific restriction endonuclease McrA
VKRPCLRCGRLVDGRSYCRGCAPPKRKRDTTWKRGWPRVRQAVLAAHNGACGLCGANATAVHHLIPRAELPPGPDANDPSRLLPVCDDCHRSLHIELERSR